MKSIAVVLWLLLFSPADKKPEPASSCAQILSGAVPPAIEQPKQAMNYRLTTEYTMLNPTGGEAGTHIVTGDYTATADEIRWTSVTTGPAAGHAQPATHAEHQRFAEGVHYSRVDTRKVFTPEFFHDFPATATDERNLTWDQVMFDSFVHNLDKLRLNQPVAAQSGDVDLGGGGQFTNRRIELTWVGIGRRNGEDCVLIHYEALLNHFTVDAKPITVTGRSDYLGDIWVSVRTHQIEYGTLLEEVAGTLTNLPGSPSPQPLHVLRVATLEHLQ